LVCVVASAVRDLSWPSSPLFSSSSSSRNEPGIA
jgi:hypothetical protein